ncbi:MAG: hypothetical protein V8S95_02185 [Odoribacter sp.]
MINLEGLAGGVRSGKWQKLLEGGYCCNAYGKLKSKWIVKISIPSDSQFIVSHDCPGIGGGKAER